MTAVIPPHNRRTPFCLRPTRRAFSIEVDGEPIFHNLALGEPRLCVGTEIRSGTVEISTLPRVARLKAAEVQDAVGQGSRLVSGGLHSFGFWWRRGSRHRWFGGSTPRHQEEDEYCGQTNRPSERKAKGVVHVRRFQDGGKRHNGGVQAQQATLAFRQATEASTPRQAPTLALAEAGNDWLCGLFS